MELQASFIEENLLSQAHFAGLQDCLGVHEVQKGLGCFQGLCNESCHGSAGRHDTTVCNSGQKLATALHLMGKWPLQS